MADLEMAVAPMHRLCKKAGADRVSEAAAKELAKALEEIGVKVAKEALDFAMHAGRKTIKAEDIEIAADFSHVHRPMRHGLRSVDQGRNAAFPGDPAEFGNGIDGAKHVGNMGEGEEPGP